MNTSKYLQFGGVGLLVATALSLSACKNSEPEAANHKPDAALANALNKSDFKRIVYTSSRRTQRLQLIEQLPYVTHVNYAFANPTAKADGEIAPFNMGHFLMVRDATRAAGKKFFLSFGGWQGDDCGYDELYEKIAANPKYKKRFIDNILELVREHDLDGIDMDWEYPRIEGAQDYEDFIVELAAELDKENADLTSAVIGTKSKPTDCGDAAAYSDKALAAFDWINLMTYDDTTDNHSPYDLIDRSLAYWRDVRNIPVDKLVLGLPAYARPSWRDYSAVIAENTQLACQDTTEFNGKTDYYNGLPMIAKKTRRALDENLAGIMLWELPLDAREPELSIVHTMAKASVSWPKAEGICSK